MPLRTPEKDLKQWLASSRKLLMPPANFFSAPTVQLGLYLAWDLVGIVCASKIDLTVSVAQGNK